MDNAYKINELVRYYPALHEPMLNAWLAEWNLPPASAQGLPPTGFVYRDNVMAFLIKTDSEQAFIDRAISRPGTTSFEREEGFKAVFAALIHEAKMSGYRVITTFCKAGGALSDAFADSGLTPLPGSYTFQMMYLGDSN